MKLDLTNLGSFNLVIENDLDTLWVSRFLENLFLNRSKESLQVLSEFIEVSGDYTDDDDNHCSGNRFLQDILEQVEGQGSKENPYFGHLEDDVTSINFSPN